jgi:hypothetical protein
LFHGFVPVGLTKEFLRSDNMAMHTAMVVNPFLDLNLASDKGAVTAITVRAPIKGEGLKVTTIDRNRDTELFGLLVVYCHTKGAHLFDSITESERERLNSIGFLVTEGQVPSPVYFSYDLGDVPADLLPRRAHERSQSLAEHGELIVDPTFHHLGNATTPVVRKYQLSNPFPEDRSWFSIVDGLSAPAFYSYTPDMKTSVESLSVGSRCRKACPRIFNENFLKQALFLATRAVRLVASPEATHASIHLHQKARLDKRPKPVFKLPAVEQQKKRYDRMTKSAG